MFCATLQIDPPAGGQFQFGISQAESDATLKTMQCDCAGNLIVGDVSSRLYDQTDRFESPGFYECPCVGVFQCSAERPQVNDLSGFRVLYRHYISLVSADRGFTQEGRRISSA